MVKQKIIGPIRHRFKEFGDYCVGENNSSPPEIMAITNGYKERFLKSMSSLRPYQLDPLNKSYKHIPDGLITTLKRDGMFNILYYDKDSYPFSVFCNSNYGRVRYNLPVNKEIELKIDSINETDIIDELKEILVKLNKITIFNDSDSIHNLILAGELYANENRKNDRPRIDGIIYASLYPKSIEDLERIHFDIFDILFINGVNILDLTYENRLRIIKVLFPLNNEENLDIKVKIIWHKIGVKASEVKNIFQFWVDQQGQEGLVIQTPLGLKFKLKPEYEVDAAIIGYAEMRADKNFKMEQKLVGSLLIALMRPDGSFQKLTSVDSGLTVQQRIEFYNLLKDDNVISNCRAFNEVRQPFRFVRPLRVIEIKFIDIITKSTLGNNILKWVLKFDDNEWKKIEKSPFVELSNPWLSRIRFNVDEGKYPSLHAQDPKEVKYQDIPIEQIVNLV